MSQIGFEATATIQENGSFYRIIPNLSDDFPQECYPITLTPPPVELDGKCIRFVSNTHTWVDASDDAQAARDKALAKAQGDAVSAQEKANTAQATADTAAGAVTELMDYVATLPVVETSAPAADTATDPAETTDKTIEEETTNA